MEWINTNDKMQEQYVDVLVYYLDCPAGVNQAVAGINADGNWQEEGDYSEFPYAITHWMPLPKPPKVDND